MQLIMPFEQTGQLYAGHVPDSTPKLFDAAYPNEWPSTETGVLMAQCASSSNFNECANNPNLINIRKKALERWRNEDHWRHK
jgi:hypothetical protein